LHQPLDFCLRENERGKIAHSGEGDDPHAWRAVGAAKNTPDLCHEFMRISFSTDRLRHTFGGADGLSRGTNKMKMKKILLTAVMFAAGVTITVPEARADWVGAGAGAGAGLVVAGPVGAVAGGVIGGVFGRPFWGPSVGRGHCWTDDHLHRHCRSHW
jgi:osmotically inducible lipoprotein OsmB